MSQFSSSSSKVVELMKRASEMRLMKTRMDRKVKDLELDVSKKSAAAEAATAALDKLKAEHEAVVEDLKNKMMKVEQLGEQQLELAEAEKSILHEETESLRAELEEQAR